jgi:hypothetical protein
VQVVLSSHLCDVIAAATLKDPASSCRVLYNSAAYLSTIAHRLNIRVEVQQGVQYCYPLPAAVGAAPRQHCQVNSQHEVVTTMSIYCCDCVCLVLCGEQSLLPNSRLECSTGCRRTLYRQRDTQACAAPQPAIVVLHKHVCSACSFPSVVLY